MLRYFNVVGATHDGLFGEFIQDNPKLISSALRVGLNMQTQLTIYGNTYPTLDGTAIRDYVSLEDVVGANMKAVQHLQKYSQPLACNIGSGIGTSNLEVVHKVEKQLGKEIPIVFKQQRKEAIASIANIDKAKNTLGWKPYHSNISDIINSMIFFHRNVHQSSESPSDRVD